MAAVSGMVRGTLLRGARSGRRQRRTWSTEAVECRCLLSGTAIGDLVQTYPVTVQFSELGHFGDARVFGDTLFIPGNRDDGAPVLWKGNLATGTSETIVFAGDGNISGVIQRNGEFVFTGFLDTTIGRQITYWDDAGPHVSSSSGTSFDVSAGGRLVGHRGSVDAYYYDVGTDIAVVLPGVVEMYLGAYSITDDGRFIGGGAFNDNLDSVGIVYEQQADGSYALLDVQYVTPEGLSLLRMDVIDGPEGPLGVGVYADVNGAVQTALWGVKDGVYKTHLGAGYVTGAVYESRYLYTSLDQGIVTATDLATLQTETYTSTTLFGSAKDFKGGSLFVTADGNLGVVGTDPVTKLATVKTFKIPQNTAPVVSAWDGTASFVENAQPVVLDANALVSDGDSSDFAGGSVTVSVVSHGEAADRLSVRHVGNSAGQIGVSGNGISYGGVLIGTMTGGSNGSTPLVVTLNSAANAQSVTALLRAVTFQNVSDSPSTQTRQVQVTVADGGGGSSAAVTKAVSVTAVNDAPVILAFDGSVTYTENAVPVLLDMNASVSDVDSPNFSGGTLTVSITRNAQTTDRIAVKSLGTGPGQIAVAGTYLRYGGVTFGRFTAGTSLVVQLYSQATPAAVTALLRAVTFASVSQNPSIASRMVTVTLTDGDGGKSNSPTKSVNVRAVNDVPVITGFDGVVTYRENGVPVLLDTNTVVTDPDGLNVGGGVLTVSVSGNAQSTDRLGVRDIGTGAGQISVSGSTIKLGSVVCGTFSGGTTAFSPITVTLSASATTASATSILRALTFSNISENPSALPRTIRVVFTDGAGGKSIAVTKTVNVVPVNDAPVINRWDTSVSTVGNANPILLDSNAAVMDVDSSNFEGGKLTVWISANAHGFDRLGVRHVGNSAGQIGVSGSNIRFEGIVIGTFTGGTGGSVPLVVNLKSSATKTAVNALMRSLTYQFARSSSARVLKTDRVSLSDGDGGVSSSVGKLLTLERTL